MFISIWRPECQRQKVLYRACRTCMEALRTFCFKNGLPRKAKWTNMNCSKSLERDFELGKYEPYLCFWKSLLKLHHMEKMHEKHTNSQQKGGNRAASTVVQGLRICKYVYYKPLLCIFIIFIVKLDSSCKYLEEMFFFLFFKLWTE